MSRHQIEITADEQHYILNGICYHITFPIHLALEHPIQQQRVCPERPRRPLNLNYREAEIEDYFERFLSQMEASVNHHNSSADYDAILELSDDEEEELDSFHYVSEATEDEEEDPEDKENQSLFSKMEQAIHDGRITFREK
jgi:hypothetical protein